MDKTVINHGTGKVNAPAAAADDGCASKSELTGGRARGSSGRPQ